MAIFLFVAWGIQLAESVGILDDESWNPTIRAYRLANAGMEAVKRELCGRRLLEVARERVRYLDAEGAEWALAGGPSLEKSSAAGERVLLADLGAEGSVSFTRSPSELEVDLVACCPGGTPTRLQFKLPA